MDEVEYNGQILDGVDGGILVAITDFEIPSVEDILVGDKPSICVHTSMQNGRDIKFDMLLDKFADSTESDSKTVTKFCSNLDISRHDISSLIAGPKIPLRIRESRNGTEVQLRYIDEPDMTDLNATNHGKLSVLEDLWRAESYAYGRITRINKLQTKPSINVEIPWVNKEATLHFSINPSDSIDKPLFPEFYKNLTGHYPVRQNEVSSIVGKEVKLDYRGNLKIHSDLRTEERSQSLIRSLQNKKYISRIKDSLFD